MHHTPGTTPQHRHSVLDHLYVLSPPLTSSLTDLQRERVCLVPGTVHRGTHCCLHLAASFKYYIRHRTWMFPLLTPLKGTETLARHYLPMSDLIPWPRIPH